MSELFRNAVRKAAAKKRKGTTFLLSEAEREEIRKRAQNTPYLDQMLKTVSNSNN